MVKYLFITLVLSISITSFAQVNIQKGYAIAGYDVVSYFKGKPVKGSYAYMVNHKGVKYKFTSQDNANSFKKMAEKYVPMYGGYCAYAMAKDGSKVKINPSTYEIKDGKLYLFYNSGGNNTLDKWNKEGASTLKEAADKNWKSIQLSK